MTKATVVLIAFLATGSCRGLHAPYSEPPQQIVRVLAAASLQPAFDKIRDQLQAERHIYSSLSFAGTQTLVAQLTQGAPGDVFASADTTHMTTVQNAGLVAGAPRIFAHNRLEIAVAPGNPKHIQGLADLSRPGLVVVLADPSVPAGKYAKEALAKAHVTVRAASLEPQVTGVLTKVSLGEADAGIVYVSDVTTSGRVDGIAIPDDQNVVADYEIAALNIARSPSNANAFISFVFSPSGQAILKAAGFESV